MTEHLSTHPLHHPRRVRGSGTGKSPVRASASDVLRVVGRIALPALASGGRSGPVVLAAAQKRQWDASAISAMQALRAEHGGAPVRLRLAGRDVVLLVEPDDVARVLDESSKSFATVEPRPRDGGDRRRVEEAPDRELAVVREEMGRVVRHACATGSLDWACFASGWRRVAHRLGPGSSTRDDRVPHQLVASDDEGVVVFRALHLVASYPHEAEPLRAELDDLDLTRPQPLDQARAAVLESVRLWPTTPLLLRRSTEPTRWGGLEAPSGTTFAVFTPFFHRDWQTLTYANRFQPRIWLDGEAAENPALASFRDLVPRRAATALAALLEHHTAVPTSAVSMTPDVPATVNHFALSFRLRQR